MNKCEDEREISDLFVKRASKKNYQIFHNGCLIVFGRREKSFNQRNAADDFTAALFSVACLEQVN